MTTHHTNILILGAGLQGTGVALELARRGLDVVLMDQDERPLNRASLRNEGKIHLGFIYANDRTRDTAFLQLDGGLRFRRILARWMDAGAGPAGGEDWLELSTPFHYLVAADSLVTPELLADHYAAVEQRYRELTARDPDLDYLGARPERLLRSLNATEIAQHFDPARFAAGFVTAERAIDTDLLAARLRHRVAGSSRVTFVPSHVARAIAEESDGFVVEGEGTEGTWRFHARQVVNATWERRFALDRQVGIPAPANLLHRLKYRVVARLPQELCGAPSVSMVLGRYGDIVIRSNGTAYLSWYPAGLRGWSHAIEPPAEWDAPCRGEVCAPVAREVAAEILAGIDAWFPGIARCEPLLVDAGVVVALGTSDVDDAGSALHDRKRIGVTSKGHYHSVDPGKLTTAPLFALEVADRVERIQRATGPAR